MRHYEGEIGTFDYDENVWEISTDTGMLRLKEGYKGKISLPKGIKSCHKMFWYRGLSGCWFEDFDTSGVENMSCMFNGCTFPKGFSLGDKFDTSRVENMGWMFRQSSLPEGFSLGNKFDTSSVKYMDGMFAECSLDGRILTGTSQEIIEKLTKGRVSMKHYDGELGVFDYDENVWEITCGPYSNGKKHLAIVDGYEGGVVLPKGVKSCRYMFSYLDLQDCWLEDFDTSNVEDMSFMFYNCVMPEGFSLGDMFDTSNVKDMRGMFTECKFSESFSLGDKFDTSNVKNMRGMFLRCEMPEGFSLGDKFDTSNVEDMSGMFANCKIPEGFSLKDKFNTSSVKDMYDMFSQCELPEGFSLGDKFDTSNVEDMEYMFASCKIPEGFSLGDKFDTSNVKNMENIFRGCKMPKGFSLGDKFDTSNVTNMRCMFEKCEMSEGFSLGDKFNTSNVKDMACMFSECIMPQGFTLGNKFDTSDETAMFGMFEGCKMPEGFSLGYRFNTSSVARTGGMFKGCYIGDREILDVVGKGNNLEIIKQLRKPIPISNDQKVNNIIKEIQRLVQNGKSKEAKENIRELSKYTDEKTIVKSLGNSIPLNILSEGMFLGNSSSITAKKYIEKTIIPDIDSLFFTKDKNHSSYTVGEVLDILYKEHDINIVNAAMCEYLRHQYIEND